ncbi:MAG: hypothetical protein Alpg2KO_29220 [Alphaproteobacteria bacterium]
MCWGDTHGGVRCHASNYKIIRPKGDPPMRKLLLASASLAVMAATPMTASAQEFTDLYVFGDSLSDVGNAFALSGGTNPPPPYFDGRFSNGPVWSEQDSLVDEGLVGATDAANNFAVGGARVGSNTATFLQDQVTNFTGGLTAPADGDGLYAIWIGANDYLGRLSTEDSADVIADVIGDTAAQIQALAGVGATDFIVFNLPDLGGTPAAGSLEVGTPGTIDGLNEVTAAHNSNLASTMEQVEAGLQAAGVDASITVVDINALFADVVANGEFYGLTNASVPCLVSTSGPTGACATAEATDAAVFWDEIHPTANAHEFVALYVLGSLSQSGDAIAEDAATLGSAGLIAPTRVFRSNQVRLAGFRSGQQLEVASTFNGRQLASMEDESISDSGDMLANETRMGTKRVAVWGQGDWYDGDTDSDGGAAEFDYDGWMATVGLDYLVSKHLTIGASVGYGEGEGSAQSTTGTDTDFDSVAFSVYGTTSFSNFYADASAGFTLDQYDTSRETFLGTASADTDGESYWIGGEVGYNFHYGAFTFGPLANLRYTKVEIDGYTESGAGALNMTVDAQDVESVVGGLGAHVSGRFGERFTVMPNLRVVAEKELAGDDRTVRTVTSGGAVNVVDVDNDDDIYVRVGGGLTAQFSDAVTGTMDYEAGFDDSDVDHAVTGRLKLRF